MRKLAWLGLLLAGMLVLAACQGAAGPAGSAGPQGSQGPQGPAGPPGPAGAVPTDEQTAAVVQSVLAGAEPDPKILAHSGRLYDKWWGELATATPEGNNALWALQATNTRSGGDTWRCKECHGWDYKGNGGAYSKGSHYTGFPGIYKASSLSREQLTQIMSGGTDYRHDFRNALPGVHLGHIVDFIKWGLVNETLYIDYATKKPIGADTNKGKQLYDSVCAACHGADGKMIDFHDGEGVGTIANSNPWETLHKIRFGHPASAMPAAVTNGWSTEDSVDVLGYSQTLPE